MRSMKALLLTLVVVGIGYQALRLFAQDTQESKAGTASPPSPASRVSPVPAGQAEGIKPSSTGRFYYEVVALARQYYPEMTSHTLRNRLHFEHNTRVFLVHHRLPPWSDPEEERGPNDGGILCDMSLSPGKPMSEQDAPELEHRYFKRLLLISYSAKHDCRLSVQLDYPADASPEFLKQLESLVMNFERYLGAE